MSTTAPATDVDELLPPLAAAVARHLGRRHDPAEAALSRLEAAVRAAHSAGCLASGDVVHVPLARLHSAAVTVLALRRTLGDGADDAVRAAQAAATQAAVLLDTYRRDFAGDWRTADLTGLPACRPEYGYPMPSPQILLVSDLERLAEVMDRLVAAGHARAARQLRARGGTAVTDLTAIADRAITASLRPDPTEDPMPTPARRPLLYRTPALAAAVALVAAAAFGLASCDRTPAAVQPAPPTATVTVSAAPTASPTGPVATAPSYDWATSTGNPTSPACTVVADVSAGGHRARASADAWASAHPACAGGSR